MKDQLLAAVLPQIVGIVFTILCAVGTLALNELRKRFKNTTFNLLLDQLDKLAAIVVAEVEQTVVEPAKKAAVDGKLTVETAVLVRDRAIKRLRALLGDKNSELAKVFKDSEAVLVSMIEAKVLELRKNPIPGKLIALEATVEEKKP